VLPQKTVLRSSLVTGKSTALQDYNYRYYQFTREAGAASLRPQRRTPNQVVLKRRVNTQLQSSRLGSIALSFLDVKTPFDRTC